MRKLVRIAAVVALAGCGSSSEAATTTTAMAPTTSSTVAPAVTSSTTPRPTTPTPPSGATVISKNEDGLSNGVRVRLDSYRFDNCPSDYGGGALAGHTFLIADVTLENRSNEMTIDYSILTWTAFDEAGNSYPAELVTPCEGRPDTPALSTGTILRTRYAFEIPGGATGLSLRWDGAPVFGVSKPQPVTISIGE